MASIINNGTLLDTGVKVGGRCGGGLFKKLLSVVTAYVNVTFGGKDFVPSMAMKTDASIWLSEMRDPPLNKSFILDLSPMIKKEHTFKAQCSRINVFERYYTIRIIHKELRVKHVPGTVGDQCCWQEKTMSYLISWVIYTMCSVWCLRSVVPAYVNVTFGGKDFVLSMASIWLSEMRDPPLNTSLILDLSPMIKKEHTFKAQCSRINVFERYYTIRITRKELRVKHLPGTVGDQCCWQEKMMSH